MNPLKKLASDAAWYGLSSIIGRLINYFLVPFYTSGILFPKEYGVLTDLLAYVAFFNIIYTYGMETAYFRFAKNDESKTFNQILSSILLSSFALSALLVVFATPIVNLLGYGGNEIYIIYLAWIMAIDAVVAIPFARLRQQKNPKKFAATKIINICVNVGLNLFFLWFLRDYDNGRNFDNSFKIGYILLANLMANALLVILLWKEFEGFRLTYDKEYYKTIFAYAFPLIFMGLAGQFNGLADRFFIKYYLPAGMYAHDNLYMLGIYGACAKFSIFMVLVVQAYKYAAEPFFFSKAEDKNAPELFAKAMHWFIILGFLIVIGVFANVDWIKILILRSKDYHEGIIIVPFLLVANLFLGIYYNLTVWFKLTDKTKYGTYFAFFGAIITIIGNLVLLPLLGIVGAAIAGLITYFLMMFVCYYYGQKYYPIPYDLKGALKYFLVSLVAIVGIFYINFDNIWINILSKNMFVVIYLGVFWLGEKKNLPKT